jgi:hypothetical protein
MPLINTIFTKRNDPQPCGGEVDDFEYLVAPSEMILATSLGSPNGVTRANLFGTGLNNLVSSTTVRTATHSPEYDPDNIYYANATSILSVPVNGGSPTVRGAFLSSVTENFGSNARTTALRWAPDGSGFFVLTTMSTTVGARPRLFKIPYPFPANPFTPSHRTQIWAGPNEGSTRGMTFDLVGRFVFVSWTAGNGPNGIAKVAWDGSVTQTLKSFTNGVFSPQPWVSGVAYVPKDDYLYYIYSPDTSDGVYGLGRIKPDGTLDEYIGNFGTVDRGSIVIAGPTVPLEYHHGADTFYTMDDVESDGDLVVVDRTATILAVLNQFSNTLEDISLTAIS